MPDSVSTFARTKADAATDWSSANPIEEYTVVYSTGDSAKDVTLKVAQWSTADDAKKQYDALAATLTGEELGSGNVKVSGSTTGTYVVKTDTADAKRPRHSGRTALLYCRHLARRAPSSSSISSSLCNRRLSSVLLGKLQSFK
jgi:hypothetical protein